MVTAKDAGTRPASSWSVSGINGLECFRAANMVHHFRRHSHEGYTIGVIEEGFGDNRYRGSVFHLAPGKIVVMNPDEVHTGNVVSERPWSYRMFYINQETFRHMLPEGSVLPFFKGLCFKNDYWFDKIRTLHCLLEIGTDTLEQQTRAIQVLSSFARAHGKTPDPDEPGKEPRAVGRIKDFIDANFQQNVSIDDLVELTQLSRAYLIRSFQRSVGIPPYTYLIQALIKQAKKLLARRVPVAQVAYEMGFADQSHLTRLFKSITGITPKQFAVGHYPSRNPLGA